MDLGPKAEMREIRTSGLMSGIWKRRHGQLLRHRQTERVGKQLMAAPNSTAPDLDSTAKTEATSSLRARKLLNPNDFPPWRSPRTAANKSGLERARESLSRS